MPKIKKLKKSVIVIISFLVLFALAAFAWVNLRSNDSPTVEKAKTTSTAPSAQEDFTDGDNRQPVESSRNEGTLNDNNGTINQTPAQSQWTKSNDGNITVYSPSASGLLKSGSQLTGASHLNNVSFRLIDDVSGVIAQGSLKVTNGTYSGTFNFDTIASTGRLDVFTTNPDGSEASNVEVTIRFK